MPEWRRLPAGSLREPMIQTIISELENGKTILEFGSGKGTKALINLGYKVFSIEENKDYWDLYHDNYLHCPLVGDSYENRCYPIKEVLDFASNIEYDAILVDGPAQGSRCNLIELFSFLRTDNVAIFVDDINRKPDIKFFNTIKGNREFRVYPEHYGVIKDGINTPSKTDKIENARRNLLRTM